MVTFLFSSVLVLGLIAIAIYFWQKPANKTETIELPPPPPTSMSALFAREQHAQLAPAAEEQVVTQPSAAPKADPNPQPNADDLIRTWRESPDRQSTARMLHAAALSDDAETYRKAVDAVLREWLDGRIPDLSATELLALFNGEFWVLSAQTRSSGAGFLLKRTLSIAKRKLERVN
jgi:hypothetical protein